MRADCGTVTLEAGELEELAARLRTSLRITIYMSRQLDDGDGVTTAQLGLLSMAQGEGQRMGVIAKNLGVRMSSATEQVIRLERAGLVLRNPDPLDARAVVVRSTPEGDRARDAAHQQRNERMARALAGLSPEDRAVLDAAVPAFDRLNESLRTAIR